MSPDLGDDVTAWLGGVLPGQRITRTERLSGGYRNENLLLVTHSGRRFVLRRYLKVGGARASAVEAALAARVAGTVPVAAVIAHTIEPRPLLLSEFVSGRLVSVALDGDDPGGLGTAVGAALAAVGTTRFATQGFFAGPELVPEPVAVTAGLAGFVAARVDRPELVALARRSQPVLDALRPDGRLVHSDFNPKNILVDRERGRWTVRAVLDWEFAFSGPPLVDVGNMLRFAADYPPAYVDGFLAGFVDAGGELPENWREAAEALDLFALADLYSRGPDGPLFDQVAEVIGQRVR